MDAVNTSLIRKFALIAVALLFTAHAWAAITVNGATTISVALNAANTSAVLAVDGAPTFTVQMPTDWGGGPTGWLRATPLAGSAPAQLAISVYQVPASTTQVTVLVNGSDSTVATINVTFTPGSSGGPSGPVAVTPSTLALTATGAGSVTGTLTVTSTSSTATDFSAVANAASPGWTLNVSPNSGSVVSGTPVTLTVTANTGSSTVMTYNGTVTVTPSGLADIPVAVSLQVGQSSPPNSTLTVTAPGDSATSNANVTLDYASGGAVPTATLNVQSSSGAANYTAHITVDGGMNWLLANGGDATHDQTYDFATYPTVTLVLNSTGLPQGTYHATVTLTSDDITPQTATINVALNVDGGSQGVTVDPSSWTPTTPAGTSQQQAFSVTASAGYTLGYVTANESWLTVTQISNGQFTATADAAGLTAGTYTDNIAIATSLNYTQVADTNIPVTFTVTAGSGASGTQVVAPTSLAFAYQVGGAVPLPQVVFIPGQSGQAYTVVETPPVPDWIRVNPPGSTLPGEMNVPVVPSSLAPAATPYRGNITIETANGRAVIPVSILVTDKPVIFTNPGSLIFGGQHGTASQRVDVSSSAGGAIPLAASASQNASWLQVSSTDNGAAGHILTVSVNASGLEAGTYSGAVQLLSDGLANSPALLPVVLIVGGGGDGQGGALTLSSSALTFNAAVNGQAPASQVLTVDSPTGSFTAAAQASNGLHWLTISPTGTITGAHRDITVSVSQTGLPVGTYSGQITLNTQQVPVTLTVASSLSTGNVTVNKSSLSFTYQTGASAPAAQALTVSNASGSASIPYTVAKATTSGGNWLQVSRTSGVTGTSATVSVSVGTAGLSAGTYNGTVTIQPDGGSPVLVQVVLSVTAPSISVDLRDLTFSYRPGDSRPAAKNVQVSGGAFSAVAVSTGNWLAVTPASGTANPTQIAISVDPGSLAPGTYNGHVTVSGTGSVSGAADISVAFTVQAPLPTINFAGSAASYASDTLSPGEIITIFGTEIGPTTPAFGSLDSSGKMSTTAGGVQVFVSGYPAPITYASGTQINAVVPYEIKTLRSASIWVKFLNQTSNSITVPVTASTPGIFTANASGTGPGLILNHPDYSLNSAAKPIQKGGYIMVYITGEGETVPAGVTGKITTADSMPGPLLPVAVRVGGIPATATFAGEAPFFVSGIMQINVKIPENAPSGDVPLVISIGTSSTQTGVTVRIQ